VLEDLTGQHSEILAEADFAVVLGGDGSILRAVAQLGFHQIPILGVNVGRLGFLADVSLEQFDEVFDEVIHGRCRVINHLMFRCQLTKGETLLDDVLGLNEAAVLGGPPHSLLDVDLYINDVLVTTYSCDGLLISTPVGSTAHSLSAGGPILEKSLAAFVICPVSPHTLTMRPLVDSDDNTYELEVREPNESTSLVVDGRLRRRLQPGDRIRVEKAQPRFQLIETLDRGYYRTLREKLGWAGQMRRNREVSSPP
jgi:NAD+ kinase